MWCQICGASIFTLLNTNVPSIVVPSIWCQICGAQICGASIFPLLNTNVPSIVVPSMWCPNVWCHLVRLGTAWISWYGLDWLGLAFGQDFP